jgi:hypothetical protein
MADTRRGYKIFVGKPPRRLSIGGQARIINCNITMSLVIPVWEMDVDQY